MTPVFSVVVPTRQRPDTLISTLETLTSQPGDDYEIIVADNCGDEAVAKVIRDAQARNPAVRHLRCDTILPMGDNWERGLAACKGDYVTILGDDDGFLPTTLMHMRQLIAAGDPKVISWAWDTYWWPDTIAYWNANCLFVDSYSNHVEWRDSNAVLTAFFNGQLSFGALPMIYAAFVHRSIVEKAKSDAGCYFSRPELPPDVVSGVINLKSAERYVHSHRPLTLRGNSKRSNGTAQWARAFGKEQRDQYFRDEGKTLDEVCHPSIVPSPNLGFIIANVKLYLKDIFFADRGEFRIDLAALVTSTIASLNAEPESYEDNLKDALALAAKIGLAVDPKTIPAKQAPPSRDKIQGMIGSPQTGFKVVVNCDQAGVFDVAGAAKLAEAISAPLDIRGLAQQQKIAQKPAPSETKKVGRNDPCPCGSGKKYKHCHGQFA